MWTSGVWTVPSVELAATVAVRVSVRIVHRVLQGIVQCGAAQHLVHEERLAVRDVLLLSTVQSIRKVVAHQRHDVVAIERGHLSLQPIGRGGHFSLHP